MRNLAERALVRVALALLVVTLPLALVLTNIRILAFDAGYWQQGYVRNRVDASTGLTMVCTSPTSAIS